MPALSNTDWLNSPAGAWVVLALALYGLACALSHLAQALQRVVRHDRSESVSILVLIHNQEEHIERIIRSLMGTPVISGGHFTGRAGEIILIDLDSTDDTPVILDRLFRQYEGLRLVRLPREQLSNACETAVFLSRHPVSVLLDLRQPVSAPAILKHLPAIFQ